MIESGLTNRERKKLERSGEKVRRLLIIRVIRLSKPDKTN